jgi:hypothetical protein
MQAAGSLSHIREQNDKNALPVTMIAAGAGFTNLRSSLPADRVKGGKAFRSERDFRAALTEMAVLHATWWGEPLGAGAERWELAWDLESGRAIDEARHAILEIADASWGTRMLPAEQIRGWLRLLDDPRDMVGILAQMPTTLIYRGEMTGDPFDHRGRSAVRAMSGPAPYDLACFYSSSRWWYGRLPMGRVEMRNWYLERLNERLGAQHLNRYTFDLGFDASLAWGFAARWIPFFVENHTALLARASHLRATVIDPAWASLRRCS